MKPTATEKQPTVLPPTTEATAPNRWWLWVAAGLVIGTAALYGARLLGDDGSTPTAGVAVERAAALVPEPVTPSVEPAAVASAPAALRPTDSPSAAAEQDDEDADDEAFEEEVELAQLEREEAVALERRERAAASRKSRARTRRAPPKPASPPAVVEEPAEATPQPDVEPAAAPQPAAAPTPTPAAASQPDERRDGVFLEAKEPERPRSNALMHVD